MAEVTPDPIMRIAMGFMASKHLIVASAIRLFEALTSGRATLDELAATCGVPRRTLGISVDAMVSLGLVDLWMGATHKELPAAPLMSGEFLVISSEGQPYGEDAAHEWLAQTAWRPLERIPLAGPASVIIAKQSDQEPARHKPGSRRGMPPCGLGVRSRFKDGDKQREAAMRFLVLGAGGLGGYFGGMLVRGGADVSFLVRPRRAAQLAERGLVIKEPAGDLVTPVRTVAAGAVDGRYDVVLLTCKAYDLDSAIEAIAPAVGPGSAILPVLNGINHIDMLAERFGMAHVLGGMIIVGGRLAPNGDIIRPPITGATEDAAFGELTGERSARCEAIQAALVSANLPSRISDNILAEMWAKFCGFCCNAAASTLTRGLAGEIASAPAGAAFVGAAFDECARVTIAAGYPSSPEMVRNIVTALYSRLGSAYRPSIAGDLEDRLPTEHEHTIGDIVRRAERHGLDVPIMRAALCNLQIADARRKRAIAAST